jgi:hypothetical protein
MPAGQDVLAIPTPPDTYRPDKIASGVTIETLQMQRNTEVPAQNQAPLYQYKNMNTGF